MKFYKVVARPTLLYGSETWVTTTRDTTRLEAAEMRFLRSVKGHTRRDKIRSKVIRKELEISGIQDVRSKHKQNWINHLERTNNTRLPKHAFNYKPRGRRDCGRPRKQWQRLEAAKMHYLRSVKGHTRRDKIRSEVIRKELEISGIQDVSSEHKQNWINHLERMDNTRLLKHAFNYKPRGRRDRGRPRKRWQRIDAGTGQST